MPRESERVGTGGSENKQKCQTGFVELVGVETLPGEESVSEASEEAEPSARKGVISSYSESFLSWTSWVETLRGTLASVMVMFMHLSVGNSPFGGKTPQGAGMSSNPGGDQIHVPLIFFF